jgi:hypothetical protein
MLLSLDYFAAIERKIAATSKFNMALTCEMLNQLDAAVDWAVQSYHVFGQKNPVHEKLSGLHRNIKSAKTGY